MQYYDVIIVGLGPTGMFLANELEKHGIKYLIIDKRKAISDITRAVNITPASLAILYYSLGIDVENEVVKTDAINVYWENKPCTRLTYKKMYFPYKHFNYYTQPLLEKKLYDLIPKECVREKTELINIDYNDGVYFVDINHGSDDKIERIKCQYLIGCDGAHSFVREWLGIDAIEENYGSRFLLYDIESYDNLCSDSLYAIFEEGYIIIVPIGENKYRCIISLSDLDFSQIDQYRSDAFLTHILSIKLKISVNIIEIIWFTSSIFRHCIAKQAYSNASFICGDAYHTFSPVGGLNLNTGLQDAVNLGWKLAYVIKNHAKKELLTTYQTEREKAIELVKNKTKHLTDCLVNAKQYLPVKNYIGTIRNRSHIKYDLPYLLSGYDSTCNASSFDIKNQKENIGHHFSEFLDCQTKYKTLSEMLDSKTHCLLIKNQFQRGSSISVPKWLKLIFCESNLIKHDYMLLRPDGYIADIGDYRDDLFTTDWENFYL